MPHIDPPPMSPLHHSPPITLFESNPCVICPDPMDKSLQVTDSLAGLSSPSLEPRPPPVASDVAPTPAPPLGSHPMLTRAKASIFKTRHQANLSVLSSSGLLFALLASTEPKGFKSATKNPAWLATMDEEVQALQHNCTWVLVPRPTHTNIVPGLDYTDTFSLVIKATTVRVVLSLTVINRWPFRQLDVKNAFLNGTLTENVYMEQPPGYIDPRRVDTSLFVFHQQPDIIYLFLYVDDIIITGNNYSLLDSFARKLNSEFATKDLGSLSYFLGLEATSTIDGLFISQLKYAQDVLTRAQLLDSKPIHTHMIVSHHLTSDCPTFSDPTLYRSLVGALQYLTITRPDITHVVNSISQFLHAPTADHFLAVKCILRYVKGTLHFGLTFCPSAAPGVLVAYSNADWAVVSILAVPPLATLFILAIIWLLGVLKSNPLSLVLAVPISPKPILLCDNKSAIFLSSNPVSHKRVKHVELDYHFLRELVAGKLRTQYVPSHLQVADLFTKSVSRPLFDFFRTNLHVCSNPTRSLRGVVKDTDMLP
ncbi:Retrovirus-related Pol polyprotein from transposon RE1 [Vitis vinifera]|uniref:Retrovirus-related Pol polyprotein from transposon RE1 n=1 Tax=Vitis vinifera TaxID=29760 RepID=A0A438GPS5_VITVI|nr:Retrovirus-related Pol polyprotein from transposon RE1 [Vitis vinifera]